MYSRSWTSALASNMGCKSVLLTFFCKHWDKNCFDTKRSNFSSIYFEFVFFIEIKYLWIDNVQSLFKLVYIDKLWNFFSYHFLEFIHSTSQYLKFHFKIFHDLFLCILFLFCCLLIFLILNLRADFGDFWPMKIFFENFVKIIVGKFLFHLRWDLINSLGNIRDIGFKGKSCAELCFRGLS